VASAPTGLPQPLWLILTGLVVTVHSRMDLDAALDRVVDLLKPVAMTERVGISVRRLAPGRYEARLNGGVPPGTTRESWVASSDDRR